MKHEEFWRNKKVPLRPTFLRTTCNIKDYTSPKPIAPWFTQSIYDATRGGFDPDVEYFMYRALVHKVTGEPYKVVLIGTSPVGSRYWIRQEPKLIFDIR